MTNWWKKTIILIPVVFAAFKLRSPQAIAIDSNILIDSITNLKSTNYSRNPLVIAQKLPVCKQLNSEYKKVYAFETQSFYISICQTKDDYFYYRQSKLEPQENLLLPASIVFGGDVYQAVDGKTIYFVGMDDTGYYYSSVMHNNNEIVFEPELNPPPTRVAGRKTPPPSTKDLEISNSSSNTVGTVSSENFKPNSDNNDSDLQAQICTKDRSNINPNFNGWQEFIGKSPKIVSKYAADHGHNFTYNENVSKEVLIKTTDGLVIDLDITPTNQKVHRVCVDRLVSNNL